MRRFGIIRRDSKTVRYDGADELNMLSFYYENMPNFRGSWNCKMEIFNKNNFFFLTEFYSPYYYHEGSGSLSVMGIDYNNRDGINGQGFKELSVYDPDPI